MIKVSVIIPVYNVENYLAICLDSVLKQTIKDIEVICVDDGSTDNSLKILQEYAIKDSRVIVLTQNNLGAGVARNKALAIAQGEYLSFLDADDFFELGMLEEAYKKCLKTNAQICIYQVLKYDDQTGKAVYDKNSFKTQNIPSQEVFSYKDMPDHILNTFQNWAWNKLISHELVKAHNLKFQEIYRTNDFLFVASCMISAERITVLEKKLVYYRVGMKNNCQATNHQYPMDFLKAFLAVKQFLKDKKVYSLVEKSYLNQALSGCVYNLNSIQDLQTKEMLYNELKNNAFKEIGLDGKKEDYFDDYNKKNYSAYLDICSKSFLEYISVPTTESGKKAVIAEKNNKTREKRGLKNMPKISIIVPTYNVEEYLEECLDSIIRQTEKDIEIICINDGSTDRSLEILNRYAKNDNRIIVIDKENGGYGIGMNIGLDKATGEYIGIVEPDDYIPLNMYEDLYLKAVEYDLDFIKADFYRFTTAKNGNMQLVYNHLSKNEEKYNLLFNPSEEPEALNYIMNTWSGIYKRAFIEKHHIRHHETPGASFQDNGFWIQTFCFAKRAMILNKPYYMNRRDNPNSSVNNPEKVYCMNEEYKYIKNILTKDKELWSRFKYWYTFKKFHNYLFTLKRIAMEFKHQYVLDISEDMVAADKAGELDKSIFAQAHIEKLNLLMKDPETFYLVECLPKIAQNNAYKKRLETLEDSTSYKLGRFLTWIPRKIKAALK